MKKRLTTSSKLLSESVAKLESLRRNPTYTQQYFKTQWDQQRMCQLWVMVTENSQLLTTKLKKLVGLEERHQEAELSYLIMIHNMNITNIVVQIRCRKELHDLQAKPRQTRTAYDIRKLRILPESIAILEEEINGIVEELGGDQYRDMPSPTSNLCSFSFMCVMHLNQSCYMIAAAQGKLLIRIRVSKSQLYGARVDVFEMQRRNDEQEGEVKSYVCITSKRN